MTNPAERISEMDLARSGIISIQRDMPDKLTTWEVDDQVGHISYRVEAVARHGRPHGIDNDVILYLQSLFLRAGCPDHNRVTTTANQILLNAIGSNSKKEYERLAKALLRLAGTSWTMYRDAPDKRTGKVKGLTTTNYMFTLEMEDWVDANAETKRGLVSSSKIIIRFADEFAHSIRMGFFQLLDHDLLERLGHTNARSLYRVIQGHRVQPDGSLAFDLEMPLADWLAACGLEAERLDNAKRILDAAHRRMLETNYLQKIDLQGRGAAGIIHYSFSGLLEPQLVEMLMSRKVTRPVAEALASQHPKRIAPALKVVDERLTTGWRPRTLAGAVVDAVRNPEKWGYAPPESAKEKTTLAKKSKDHTDILEEVPQPPVREVILSLLRVRLGRPSSLYAVAALDELADDQLQNLKEVLMKPAEVSLPLATELLGGAIL